MSSSAMNKGSFFRLVVVGREGVGKSNLCMRLTRNIFVEWYDPTIEDSLRRQLLIDGRPTVLEIFDTAGCEEFNPRDFLRLQRPFPWHVDGFLVLFALNDPTSFERAEELIQSIKDGCDPNPLLPTLLVGTKSDLEKERAIDKRTASDKAADHGIRFIETSSKEGINVEEAFVSLVRTITEGRSAQGSSSSSSSSSGGGKPKCLVM